MHHASVVAIDLVGNTIDFYAVTGALDGRHDMESSAENRKPIFETGEPFELGQDACSIYFHPIGFWTGAKDLW